MAKVQSLSNAVHWTPKANDTVGDIAVRTFLKPTCTRLCSEYYATEHIVEVESNKLAQCHLVDEMINKLTLLR